MKMQIELVNLNRIRTDETVGDESVGGGCGGSACET